MFLLITGKLNEIERRTTLHASKYGKLLLHLRRPIINVNHKKKMREKLYLKYQVNFFFALNFCNTVSMGNVNVMFTNMQKIFFCFFLYLFRMVFIFYVIYVASEKIGATHPLVLQPDYKEFCSNSHMYVNKNYMVPWYPLSKCHILRKKN